MNYIALVIIDPPYGILSGVDWDRSAWGFEHFRKCFTEIVKVNLASNFCIAVFSSIQQVHDVFEAFAQVGITDRYSVVWYKKNAHGQNSGTDFLKLISAYEIITFGFYGNRSDCTMNYVNTPPAARFNVWECNIPSRQEIQLDKFLEPINPAQKPVALLRMLITRHSNPNDNILDLCSGSGTSAVAAVSLGRNIVCVEIDPAQATQIPLRVDSVDYETIQFAPADPFSATKSTEETLEEEFSQTIEAQNTCALCNSEINSETSVTCTECLLKYCSECITSKEQVTCKCSNSLSSF
jgi:hypothetical protein